MTITAETPVWDTPSGMGGTFTVALLEDDPACPTVLARVCYGRLDEAGRYHPWREWDGYTFRVARTELSHPRRFADPTPPTGRRVEGACRVA